MSDPRWFRSLYWRIAVGFVAFLAVMLAVQAGLFFLLVSRRIERLPSGTAAEFSRLTAADLATELGRDPSFDIAAFAARSDERRAPPFSIVMRDGRVASTPGLAASASRVPAVASPADGNGHTRPDPRAPRVGARARMTSGAVAARASRPLSCRDASSGWSSSARGVPSASSFTSSGR